MRQSALRTGGMGLVGTGAALLTFLLAHRAFAFVGGLEVVGPVVLARLMSLFFFVLFVMLVTSSVLVAYQTLFRARDSAFWMAAPLRPEQVHDARALEIGLMSSWAFLFLGTPLLLAHALASGAAWPQLALLFPVLVLFAALATEIGVLVAITLVRAFPGLDWKRLALLLVAGLVPVGLFFVRAFRVGQVDPAADVESLVAHALEGLGRTQDPLLPGWWASEALRAAGRGEPGRAAFLAWTLAITALLAGLLAREAAAAWLQPAWQAVHGGGVAQPVRSRTRRSRSRPARGPSRALALKDVTLFFREPAQWTQAGLVALLATVYVVNLRNVPDLTRYGAWGSVAALMNLAVVLLLVATLTTRFAFPLLSMEGRRAWIVLLAPIERRQVVLQKAALSVVLAGAFGLLAAAFSCAVLHVPPDVRRVTLVVVLATAFALSGLAVGLGAIFPELREDNPSRIVAGFGGTLDFLLGLGHVTVTVLLVGAPRVLEALGRIDAAERRSWETAGLAAACALALAVGMLPLALGARSFGRREI
jgi:ABC-2 type transport system permease protein